MDSVSGILILHPTFALVDPDNGLHLPDDTFLVLRNVPPFQILDSQDAAAGAQVLVGQGFRHGDPVTVHGRTGIVQGRRAILMEKAVRP